MSMALLLIQQGPFALGHGDVMNNRAGILDLHEFHRLI